MATNDSTPTDAPPNDHQPRTPTVGEDPRDSADTEFPPGKVWFRDLDEAVIEADRCIQCGSCAAACPSDSIGIDDLDDQPTLVKMCTGCSRCWDNCPRSGLRYERITAEAEAARADAEASADDVRDDARDDSSDDARHDGSDTAPAASDAPVGGTYAARAADDAIRSAGQDGGAVTALLAGLLERGALDGAVVARESEERPLKGEAFLASSAADLAETAGSFYNQTMQLGRFEDLVEDAVREGDLPAGPDVALVGTPCVIQGAYALSEFGRDGELDALALTVALFCTRSFEYDRLVSVLGEHGVDPADVDRIDVADGTLYAYDDSGAGSSGTGGDGQTAERDAAASAPADDGTGPRGADGTRPHGADGDGPATLLETDVSAFDAAGLDGCAECADFTGGAADVSAGTVASPDDATTLVVRSERGAAALEAAGDALELEVVDDEGPIDRLAEWNRRKAESTLPRALDPEGRLTIGYEEHREQYDDTDREPQPHNPARVYQYERWC